jgi:hypothetical protein
MGRSCRARARFHVADLREFDPPQGDYDLVVTHFFLDCFADSEVFTLANRLAAWTAPEAQWIVSDFQQAPGWLGRLWTGATIRALYAAFRLATDLQVSRLPSYADAVAAAGFCLQRRELAVGGLLRSSLWRRSR